MIIRNMFQEDINRQINGVIKVDQSSADVANPVVDVSQFAGTYVSQMQASVAQMASLNG